jgi:hypothetical protein
MASPISRPHPGRYPRLHGPETGDRLSRTSIESTASREPVSTDTSDLVAVPSATPRELATHPNDLDRALPVEAFAA